MSKDPRVRRSKHLSLVLRHDPASVGLTLDAAGWADVGQLLVAMKLTAPELDEIVATNSKKRFEFNEDRTKIRASQGHSVDVELGYEEQLPPATLYHGTSADFVASIRSTGLEKRDRHHVHLSVDQDTALVVARRRPRPVILHVNASSMVLFGHKFYLSTNGVWLTDSVPAQYIEVLS